MTVPAVVPKTHSPWGASQAHRWMECPASIRLGASIPDPPSSPYAREGTCAHHVAEMCLADGRGNAVDYVGRVFEDVEVTDEMAEAVQVYLDTVRADKALLGGKLLVENRFDLSPLHAGLYGTNDAALLAPDLLIVYDYKHGRGVPVDVIGNPQLRYYALGALLTSRGTGKVGEVELVIVQPRCYHPDGPVRRERISVLDLVEWGAELIAAVKRTLEPDSPIKTGDHCQWCKVAPTCPEMRSLAERTIQSDFAAFKAPPSPDSMNVSQLLQVLSRADMIETWLNAVRAHAEQMLEGGVKLPGWKLCEKRPTRKWTLPDEEILDRVSARFKLKKTDLLLDPELKSPAQVEKLIKGKEERAALSEFYSKVSTGYVLAPESDPRPAMLPPAVRDFMEFTPSAAKEGNAL